MIRFGSEAFTIDAAAGDTPRRTISGIAVRYNTPAKVSDGSMVAFAPGSLPVDGRAPVLQMFHDSSKVIGTVTERVETEEGMLFSARISETVLGSEALVLASDGALREVSVGVTPLKFKYDKDGVMVVTSAKWDELSVVSQGAFDAPILEVAASIHQEEEEISTIEEVAPQQETETMNEKVEAPAVVEASAATQTIFASAKREFKMPTAAEYISAFFTGGDQFQAMREGIRAAAPNVVTGDLDGILPLPIVQPTYNNFIGRRPVVDAVGAKAMPQGGKVFIRPEVTTHTSIGNQANENTAVTAGEFIVTDRQVTKGTYGGYVNLSEQSIDWSTPEVISLLLDDMGRIYANATDDVAADNLKTGATVTQNFTAASSQDPAYWMSWISIAAQTILSSSNGNLPTHIFVNPEWWGSLMQLSDTADRPLFPQVGPMNAFGNLAPGQVDGMAFGLQVVVDRNFAADTLIIGDASGYEIFEQQKGAISIDVPSTLSRTIAFRGYFATLMMDPTKFVKAAFV
jgi:phage head maturation protease